MKRGREGGLQGWMWKEGKKGRLRVEWIGQDTAIITVFPSVVDTKFQYYKQ